MISLTSKADFYETTSDLLKAIANPIPLHINRRLYTVSSLFREKKLPKSTVFQHLARLKKGGHDSGMISGKEMI